MGSFLFKTVRTGLLAIVGSALVAKLVLESNAEPTTEEIDLVAIFEGKRLASVADPFFGGKLLVAFGGALLDLRQATPSPTGIILDLAVLVGGVSLVVPEGWRVRFEGSMYGGGFSDETRTTADPDVPMIIIKGFVTLGGVQVTTKVPPGVAST